MLGSMFKEKASSPAHENGYYFIDQCVRIFEHILQFLRCGKLILIEYFNELELLRLISIKLKI